MHLRLQRALWVARVIIVALGLLVVVALLHVQRGRASAGLLAEAVEPPPGAEREGRPWPRWEQDARRPAVPDDEGVLETDRATEERAGQQEVASSLARIARLLGWGGHGRDQDHDDTEEEHDVDRIRIRDWRPLEELGALQGRDRGGDGHTTEWTDNALLRAFIARFGTVRTTSPPAPPADLEMTDFPSSTAATATTPVSTVPTSTARVETTSYPLLPYCPLNGIITSQSAGGDVASGVLEYSAAWLVSRGVGPGWRSAFLPEAILHQLSHLFGHLSLSALEQLPPTCRPGPHVLENSSAALQSADLTKLQALPARFLKPEVPLVISRGVLLPRLLATHLSALREELALRPDVQLAARSVLDICRQRLLGHRGGGVDDDDDRRAVFIGLHVRRRAVAPWSHPRRSLGLGADYFLSAMDHFRVRLQPRGVTPVFVVTTDDPGWVSDNLPVGADVCVADTEHAPAPQALPEVKGQSHTDQYVGFAVQASCQHSILDHSSAALAAAILVDGEVVYPRIVVEKEPDLSKMPGWVAM